MVTLAKPGSMTQPTVTLAKPGSLTRPAVTLEGPRRPMAPL